MADTPNSAPTTPDVTPSAPANDNGGQAVAQNTPLSGGVGSGGPRKYPINIDGNMRELTAEEIVELVPPEELHDRVSLHRASHKRMKEAAELRKASKRDSEAMQAFKEALDEEDPIAAERAFGLLGKDGKKIAMAIVRRHYELERMKPEERRAYELDEREQMLEEREQEYQSQAQEIQHKAEVQKLYHHLKRQITTAFQQAGVDLDEEAHAELVPRVAYHINAVHQETGQEPTVYEVAEFIRSIDGLRDQKAEKKLLETLSKGDLSKLTKEAREAIRKALIAEVANSNEGESPVRAKPQQQTTKHKAPPVYEAGNVRSFKQAR